MAWWLDQPLTSCSPPSPRLEQTGAPIVAMDFLKAEIAAQKRKAPSPDTNAEVSVSPRGAEASGSSSKYIRRGEEEAKRREEEQQERRQAAERQARIEQLKEQERQQGERAQSRVSAGACG